MGGAVVDRSSAGGTNEERDNMGSTHAHASKPYLQLWIWPAVFVKKFKLTVWLSASICQKANVNICHVNKIFLSCHGGSEKVLHWNTKWRMTTSDACNTKMIWYLVNYFTTVLHHCSISPENAGLGDTNTASVMGALQSWASAGKFIAYKNWIEQSCALALRRSGVIRNGLPVWKWRN